MPTVIKCALCGAFVFSYTSDAGRSWTYWFHYVATIPRTHCKNSNEPTPPDAERRTIA